LDKEATEGKLSLCTACGSQFILTREDLKRAKPKCLNCSNTKKARTFKKAQQLTQYLGTDMFPLHINSPEDIEEPEPDFSDFSNLYPDPPDLPDPEEDLKK
jgi:hypothetical protein